MIEREGGNSVPPSRLLGLQDVASRRERRQVRSAFKLIELLVVIGIISVLISLLLPAIDRAEGAAKKIKCIANMRQLGAACAMYSADNSNHMIRAHWYAKGIGYGSPNYIGGGGMYYNTIRPYLGLNYVRKYKDGFPPDSYDGPLDPSSRQADVLICPSDPDQGYRPDYNGTTYGRHSYCPSTETTADQAAHNRNVLARTYSTIEYPAYMLYFSEMKWWEMNTNWVRPKRNENGVMNTPPHGEWRIDHMPRKWHDYDVSILFADGHVQAEDVRSLYPPGDAMRGDVTEDNEWMWYAGMRPGQSPGD